MVDIKNSIEAHKKLNHPSIIKLEDVFISWTSNNLKATFILIMELAETSLIEKIKKQQETPFDEAVVLKYFL